MQEDPTAARTLHQRILDLSDRIAAHANLIREAADKKPSIDTILIEENRQLIAELNELTKEFGKAAHAKDQGRSAKGMSAA